jgi:inhibitor of cysteine peptidase
MVLLTSSNHYYEKNCYQVSTLKTGTAERTSKIPANEMHYNSHGDGTLLHPGAFYWWIPIKERKARMFKKVNLAMITVILLASLAGCKSSTPEDKETNSPVNQQLLPIISGKTASLQLDASADGTTQQLKIGEVMAITLESNPSTGFGWFATSSNPDIIAQNGESQYQEPQSSSTTPVVGAAGTETLSFQALKAGTATLTLDYKRGWETDVAPEKTISIMMEVK